MSEGTNTPAAAAPAANTASSPAASSEDALRRELRATLQSMSRREPLDPTYKRLLESRNLTRQSAVVPKNKFYRKVGSRLRERVEVYMREIEGKDPFDRIDQRKPMVEASMRFSFTLRESKDHEQKTLLQATLAATAMHPERKRSLDGMAAGLQNRTIKKARTASPVPTSSSAAADLELHRQQAMRWEDDQRRIEAEERRRKDAESQERKKRLAESGSQAALHRIIEPVFKKLWEMKFSMLDTNPFRVIIDRETAPQIAPDYFNIVSVPMNLVYIREKVEKLQYTTLPQFFGDVDLMIENALKYNAGDANPYRVAALELKKTHEKIVKRVWNSIQEKQQQRGK
ncbi:MAG: hypothetical protein SGARI_001606 [Bacillariaceae sp.]